MPKNPPIIHILQSHFGYSLHEAQNFINDMEDPLKTNLLKNGFEDPIGFLRNLIFWNYDEMVFVYQQYIKNLQLDENTFYGKILDIGSSWGYFIDFAQRKNAFAGSVMIGIDHNKNFVKKGQQRGLDLRHMSALDLGFPQEFFDLIVSHYALPLVLFDTNESIFTKNIENWLFQVLKILKKGGELRFISAGPHEKNPHFAKKGQIIQKVIQSFSKKLSENYYYKTEGWQFIHSSKIIYFLI